VSTTNAANDLLLTKQSISWCYAIDNLRFTDILAQKSWKEIFSLHLGLQNLQSASCPVYQLTDYEITDIH